MGSPPPEIDLSDAEKLFSYIARHRSEDEWETFDKTVRRLSSYPGETDRNLLRRLLDRDLADQAIAQEALERLSQGSDGENEGLRSVADALAEWRLEAAQRKSAVRVWLL